MPVDVLAVCDRCGLVFPAGIVLEDGVHHVIIRNVRSECPRCHAMAPVPGGMYETVDDALGVLALESSSLERLQRIQSVLESARAANASPEQFAATLEREAPEFADVAKRLLVPKDAGEFYALIAALLAAVTLVIAVRSQDQEPSPEALSEIMTKAIAEGIAESQRISPEPKPVTVPTPARSAAPVKKLKEQKQPAKAKPKPHGVMKKKPKRHRR